MPTFASPQQVLFDTEKPFPMLPAVDHYAGSEKLMRKAMQLQHELGPIFDITFDCEDGAHAGAEAEHARMVAELINCSENRFGRIGVRVHDITHPQWRQDLDILVGEVGRRLAFITWPKANGVAEVQEMLRTLKQIETAHGCERAIPVHVLIETHGGLRDAWQIAALDRVQSLDFGLMDFVSAHHGALNGAAMRSPGQFEHPMLVRAKTEIAAAALGNGAVPSHNVTTELRDIDAIRSDAERARNEFGFLRMWSIHPNQIMPIVEAMRPDFSEVADAGEILVAAQEADWGPISHKGLLHDRASYRYYWELLCRARATGMRLAPEIDQRFF